MSFGMIRYLNLVVKMHSELLTAHLTNYACFSGFQSVHQDVGGWKQALIESSNRSRVLVSNIMHSGKSWKPRAAAKK